LHTADTPRSARLVLRTSTRGGAVDRAPTCGTACVLGVRMDVREEAGPSHSGKLSCIAPARAHTRALAVSWPLTRRAKVFVPASAHVRPPTCTFTVCPGRTHRMHPTEGRQRRSGTPSPAVVSRASHSTVNPATPPPHPYDASRDDKRDESQHRLPTPGKRYAHAYCVPRAGLRLTAPRPHERDAPERSAR